MSMGIARAADDPLAGFGLADAHAAPGPTHWFAAGRSGEDALPSMRTEGEYPPDVAVSSASRPGDVGRRSPREPVAGETFGPICPRARRAAGPRSRTRGSRYLGLGRVRRPDRVPARAGPVRLPSGSPRGLVPGSHEVQHLLDLARP